jgi:hypothetical protein
MTITTDQILEIYRSGSYGTSQQPNRSSSVKQVFWDVYLGRRSAADYRNNVLYPAARAGERAAKLEK